MSERWKVAAAAGARLALRFPPLERGARGVEAAFDGALLRELRRQFPEVAVHLRGSAARGGRVPFLSDLDLAIITPGSRERFARLNAFLARWRGRHPGLRDPWQMLLDDHDRPALRKYGRLLDCHEWSPVIETDDLPSRLVAGGAWSQLVVWTADVERLLAREPVPRYRYLSMLKKIEMLREKVAFFATHDIATLDVFRAWSARHAELSRRYRWRAAPLRPVEGNLSREARVFRALTVAIVPRLRAGHPLERQNLLRVIDEIRRFGVGASPPENLGLDELFAVYYERARELTDSVVRGKWL